MGLGIKWHPIHGMTRSPTLSTSRYVHRADAAASVSVQAIYDNQQRLAQENQAKRVKAAEYLTKRRKLKDGKRRARALGCAGMLSRWCYLQETSSRLWATHSRIKSLCALMPQ